jgi:phage tail-like protein
MTASMNMTVGQTAQRLPSYLPAIYREQPFVGQYLWAFEQVLLDLERQIDNLAALFDPMEAREDFLPWLSTWVAFTLRADLEPAQQRAFLSRIIPLYRRRGTLKNLQDLLAIFTTGVPTVEELEDPHHFRVALRLKQATPDVQLRQIAIAHALVDLEKPAHTFYELDVSFPTMQIGVTSHIGLDTLLGTIDDQPASPTGTGGTEAATPADQTLRTAGTKKAGGTRVRAKGGRHAPSADRAPTSPRRKRDAD